MHLNAYAAARVGSQVRPAIGDDQARARAGRMIASAVAGRSRLTCTLATKGSLAGAIRLS
jgi:hypothetical protein